MTGQYYYTHLAKASDKISFCRILQQYLHVHIGSIYTEEKAFYVALDRKSTQIGITKIARTQTDVYKIKCASA